jgi:hypothetical protein
MQHRTIKSKPFFYLSETKTRKIKFAGFVFYSYLYFMVKKSNLKMGIVPKLTPKKTPNISHLTGVQITLDIMPIVKPTEAHGSPTLNELFPDVPKTTTKKELIAALVKERKELLKQFDPLQFQPYSVRFDTYLRLKAVNYLLNRFGI